jgi:A/G-specific adenine glycosylase
MSARNLRASASRLDVAGLHRRLLAWYRRHRRDLPWRATRDPYAIWLSEIMLQQTQIATATPYYHAFLQRFPTLESLARAREADVLTAWAGLGYYRRARHFHAAARVVVREHDGRVPETPEQFQRLPGVGRYTTGAVLSIAFDRPLPVLDGNVARVLSRLAALPASVKDSRGAKLLWALAESLVPMRRPGDWNQALMELGAVICTPRSPRCGVCPIRSDCRALALDRVDEFPPVAARRAGEDVRRAVARLEWRGRLVMTRLEGPLLAGMWEPPGVTLEPRAGAARALGRELTRLGIQAKLTRTGEVIHHTITHRSIAVEVWRGVLAAPPPRSARVRAVDVAKPAVALTALARKVAMSGSPV